MASELFNPLPDPRLRGEVVWVGSWWISTGQVEAASRTLLDPRVRHFWDSKKALVKAYRRTLRANQDPWDVYLLYGPEARWTGADPPPPDFWMQNLGIPGAPVFDATVFAEQARQELERAAPAPAEPPGSRRSALERVTASSQGSRL